MSRVMLDVLTWPGAHDLNDKISCWRFMRVMLALLMVLISPGAYALELNDEILGWHCVNEQVVELAPEASGENIGRIIYRDYIRESPKGTLKIILTQGTGTGSLYVPEIVRSAKGVMPSSAGCELLDLSGRKAILERYEYLPLSLAVSAGEDIVLTVETASLSEEEVIHFAESILRK